MFEVCGVPADKFRQISSAVDKIDKVGSLGRFESSGRRSLNRENSDVVGGCEEGNDG